MDEAAASIWAMVNGPSGFAGEDEGEVGGLSIGGESTSWVRGLINLTLDVDNFGCGRNEFTYILEKG